ncbi:hypothetical protein NQ315_002780 [Exocentrus adspersus]|uniref:ATP-dependent DNA helicase n=1 Tax=Exocentrus adspersus TaxID=1586481 RepID=A0AAV8VJI5_9CUCU|nr:hypothetical protein NQ315_002780 [Exocentrus adspersus]
MPQAKITVQAMVHRTADDTIVPRETPVLHTDVRPSPINHTDDVQRPSAASHLDDITALLATTPPLPQQVHGNARQDPARIREEVELDVNRRRNQGNHLPTYLMAHERVSRFGLSDLGSLTRMCNHCNARYFTAEMTTLREYVRCCHKGKVSLEPLAAMPDVLKNLFRGTHPSSRHFRRYVLCYNHAFQFVSLEATLRDLPPGRAPPIYAIQGKMYHHISDVNVNAPRQRYGPVYFLDPEASVDQRVDNNQALERPLIARLEALFREINPYARAYMHLRERYNYELQTIERLRQEALANNQPPPVEMPTVTLELLTVRGANRRQYDMPVVEEVAAIYNIQPDAPATPNMRIYVRDAPTRFREIAETSELLDPLVFPLLFPRGEPGWHWNIPHQHGQRKVTLCQYYAYRLAIRDNEQRFYYGGKLAQQYCVAAYLKIENNRIRYILNNQDRLRAEEYVGLRDYFHYRIEGHNQRVNDEDDQIDDEEEAAIMGRMVILPSSFIGSPRHQQQLFQDAMAVVGRFGMPSIFLTMTTNTRWPEIIDNIPEGHTAADHPSLTSRVFYAKVNQLTNDMEQAHVFGTPVANLHVIEFQKRGLPHCHDLLILKEEDRFTDSLRIDALISAEIPDRDTEPDLYEIVTSFMVHGPCGELNPDSVCMVDEKCSKGFPKDFSETTVLSPSGHASWHINEFPMHKNTHTIYRLRVHLPNRQIVVFRPGYEHEAMERNEVTRLTGWFALNRIDPDARQYLYPEIPYHYVWNERQRRWTRRQRGANRIVVRIHAVHVRNQELYYLRLLLLHVRGAQSYEDVRTLNGVVYNTFKEACQMRNLLTDDAEWRRALTEACARDMPRQLRNMFAYILLFCEVGDAHALYNQFRNQLMEDFVRRGMTDDEAEQRSLRAIQHVLMVNGSRLAEHGLPEPNEPVQDMEPIDVQLERQVADEMLQNLNPEQRVVYDRVLAAVHGGPDHADRYLMVNAAAGSGKSYLFRALIAQLRSEGLSVIVACPTGIAASIFKDGRTIHSTFKLPFDINETTTSSVTPTSEQGRAIAAASLIIIDEVSMVTNMVFNIIEQALRDICRDERPFGNKIILIGGDFRQTLPVVVGGDRCMIVNSCIKSSRHWPLFVNLQLHTNIRAINNQQFSRWLLDLGNGVLPPFRRTPYGNIIEIPEEYCVDTQGDLIDFCFEDILSADSYTRAILTLTNEASDMINGRIMDRATGQSRTYFSADSVDTTDDPAAEVANFQVEMLNTLTPSGMAPHRLTLKVGVMIMLIRNLNLKQGLCNGTRLIVRVLGDHNIIECISDSID